MITSLSAFSYFLIVFLMSNNYVLPGSIIREFVILDNWKDVILDIKFILYLFAVSVICFFIEMCSDKYPELFCGKENYIFNKKRRTELKNYNGNKSCDEIKANIDDIKENFDKFQEETCEEIKEDNDEEIKEENKEANINKNIDIDILKEEENNELV